MKNLVAAILLLSVGIVFVAVWFSPLVGLGVPQAYSDNRAVCAYDGACYPADALIRVELAGGETELNRALEKICATSVKRVQADGLTIVYAYSGRVCSEEQILSDGRYYNVMAATDGAHVYIGTPVLSGCY